MSAIQSLGAEPSGGVGAAAKPADATLLMQVQQHRAHCAAARTRTHTLRSAAEAVHAFVSPRFVTSLAVLMVVVVAVLSLLS